jgi:asparagine synthase (glutamine-hydrolysing)
VAHARWFGGMISSGNSGRVPRNAQRIAAGKCSLWTRGTWPASEVRTANAGDRSVTIFGPCSIDPRQLDRLATNGVDRLALTAFPGCYVIVETTSSKTVIYTDPGHAWPIYTARAPDGTVWGSSALALATLLDRKPDHSWLIVSLLAPERPELLAGRSAFHGIASASPGTRITLTENSVTEDGEAWTVPPTQGSLREGAQRLRRALTDAVAVRVSSSTRPTADFSGGMDSTSLAFLAADEIANTQNRRRCNDIADVIAVTIHPIGRLRGGDMDYAKLAANGHPRIRHILCGLEEQHLPYSRMSELTPASDEPALTTIAIARAVAEFELLNDVGSDCHFTGDGGDTIVGCHPSYLADLARRWRLGLLFREAIGWGKLLRAPVLPLLASACLGALARGSVRDPQGPGPSRESVAWATPEAWSIVKDVEKGQQHVSRPNSGDHAKQQLVKAMQFVGRTARSDVQVASHYQVEVHNPFIDAQVMEAVMAVPPWMRATPHNYKPLLAAAMADLLPIAVAQRRTKGDFLADHYLGLRRNIDEVKELAHGQMKDANLVDPHRLCILLDRVSAGIPVAFSAFEPLVAAEVWLRALTAAPTDEEWESTHLAQQEEALP